MSDKKDNTPLMVCSEGVLINRDFEDEYFNAQTRITMIEIMMGIDSETGVYRGTKKRLHIDESGSCAEKVIDPLVSGGYIRYSIDGDMVTVTVLDYKKYFISDETYLELAANNV